MPKPRPIVIVANRLPVQRVGDRFVENAGGLAHDVLSETLGPAFVLGAVLIGAGVLTIAWAGRTLDSRPAMGREA